MGKRLTPKQHDDAIYRVYAFSEGVWRSPQWAQKVDVSARPIDPFALIEQITKALKPKKAA